MTSRVERHFEVDSHLGLPPVKNSRRFGGSVDPPARVKARNQLCLIISPLASGFVLHDSL